jgi:hypothetical protein
VEDLEYTRFLRGQIDLVRRLTRAGDVRGAREVAAGVAFRLGGVYTALGKSKKARIQYRRAAEYYEQAGMPIEAHTMYGILGDDKNIDRLARDIERRTEASVLHHTPRLKGESVRSQTRRTLSLLFSFCFFILSIVFSVFSLTGYSIADESTSSFFSWSVVFFILGIVFAFFFFKKEEKSKLNMPNFKTSR